MATNSASPLQYFGRVWSISIACQSDGRTYSLSSGPNGSGLQIQFETTAVMLPSIYWRAKLAITNMSASSAQPILATTPSQKNQQPLWSFGQPVLMGDTVQVSAGYAYGASGAFDPNANVLYTGRVFQGFWKRPNLTDTQLVLRCASGLFWNTYQSINTSLAAPSSDYQAIVTICQSAGIPIEEIDQPATTLLQSGTYSRQQVFTGKPFSFLNDIFQKYEHEGLRAWFSGNGLNCHLYSPSGLTPPQFQYGVSQVPGGIGNPLTNQVNQQSQSNIPTRPTIIGSPVQTQDGLALRVLLDPGVHVGDVIQLARGTLLNPLEFAYGQQLPPIQSPAGTYGVVGVQHRGDSRGRDWHTEINCLTPGAFALRAAQITSQPSN